MKRYLFLIAVTAGVVGACKKEAKQTASGPPVEMHGCADALRAAQEFSKSGLAEVPLDGAKAALKSQLAAVGAACSSLYRNDACRTAVASMDQDLGGESDWVSTCTEAYCESIAPRPDFCANGGDWSNIQRAIWTHDWSADAASEMQTVFAQHGRGAQPLAANLMAQVNEKLAAPIAIDMDNLAGMTTSPPKEAVVRVELEEAGATLKPDGGKPLQIASLDELASHAAMLKDAGFGPEKAAIVFESKADANYQQLVDAMDSFLALGYVDFAVGTEKRSKPPDSTQQTALKDAPVIVITTESVELNSKAVTTTTALAAGDGEAALTAALEAIEPRPSVCILQADKGTSVAVVSSVFAAATAAGIGDVMFAVNSGAKP